MAEDSAPAPVRIDPSSMWENMCLADELLEECELLAEGLDATGGSREPGPPEDPPRLSRAVSFGSRRSSPDFWEEDPALRADLRWRPGGRYGRLVTSIS
ncbi:MAG: hypothetical protein L6R30_23070 [Thermoanaerobaculia bacterium]|nr:hypothetical protein [Thermoanaerobaculia bacterium]